MKTSTVPHPSADNPPSHSRSAIWRGVVGFAIFLGLVPASLLVAGGDPAWLMGWVYAGLFVLAALGSRLIVLIRDPDLLRERARFGEVGGAKEWDKRLVLWVGVAGPLLTNTVAGLDHRFGWGPPVAAPVQTLSLLLVAAGYLLGVWAMLANRFFSAVVRIQTDRGHSVVSSGPYGLIRHPGYAGGVLAALALPFMLDALWALVPSAVLLVGLLVRTALEDAVLKAELDGYLEYAARVRYRLLPGVW